MSVQRCIGIATAIALVGPACESETPKKVAEDGDAAAAKKEADDPALAKRKAEREAAKKAEEDKAAALAAKVDKLAVIPDKLPKKLEGACKEMLEAYDGFMRKVLEGDMLTKWETGGNEMQLAVFKKECLKRDIATAACQAHALSMASPDLEQQLPDIMKACADKAAAN